VVRATSSAGSGPIIDSQDWLFTAPGGEHFELHIKYERGAANHERQLCVEQIARACVRNPLFDSTNRGPRRCAARSIPWGRCRNTCSPR
jgi:hypothetical protein